MTQGFNEWFNEDNHPLMDFDKWSAKISYEAGAASRQAEIDELQKRIDKAMNYVSESPLKDVSRRAMLNFLDILKGENNE